MTLERGSQMNRVIQILKEDHNDKYLGKFGHYRCLGVEKVKCSLKFVISTLEIGSVPNCIQNRRVQNIWVNLGITGVLESKW